MHFTRLYDRTTVPYIHDCVMNAIYSAQPVAMAVKQKIKAVRAFITGGHAANPATRLNAPIYEAGLFLSQALTGKM